MKKLLNLIATLLIVINLFAQENHSEFFEGSFNSPQEVTAACLTCHEGVDAAIMKTRHWNWLGDEYTNNNGEKERLGKQNIINNFCVAIPSNWARCTSCHIGYGWKDDSFDFTKGNNIDCLVCHDQTGTYKKTPTGAGMPDKSVDLVKVAQSVGSTKSANCITCHANGGGGAGVKHGDMDESFLNPTPELDVHMGKAGLKCADCHAGENHNIKGAGHGSLMAGTNHINCSDCHSESPHENKNLNNHGNSIACETCHIPTFAKEMATKTWWDWSTAGQDKTAEKDEFGKETYNKKKGDFTWEMNVIPEYSWHNGQADYYRFGDIIDPAKVVELNSLNGSIEDANSKITPFKVMRGKQIYDVENNYLIVPKLFGEGGYWKTYDWNNAAELGMKTIDMDYSGQYGFVETEMYWPINHMVVSGDQALSCTDCHNKNGESRLNWEKLGYEGDPMKTGGRFK
jgi:octaheme c-type cytochrome (tetrathionate reductase family)